MRRLLAALAALTLVGLPACSRDRTEVKATFEDVGDLQARHSVQVADVRVGSIRSIKLTDDFGAEVTMAIDPKAKVPKDSVAVLRTTSLLGEKFVELRPKGAPDQGPFLEDGDVVKETFEAPELEFVAEEAVNVLGAVVATDVATLVNTGAEAFGGRGAELNALLTDLATISSTLAAKTTEIQTVIDNLDKTTQTLAAGSSEIANLFTNLAETTRILVDNRQRALNALETLSRLARSQTDLLERYRTDIDRQIMQVDAILAVAARESAEVANLIDWLQRFVAGAPPVVPGDFAQVYGWFIPVNEDPRSPQE